MIEYHIAQLLVERFDQFNFAVNGYNENSPDSCTLITGDGGNPNHWYDRTDWQVQLLTRHFDATAAVIMADALYSFLKNRFGLQLPATDLPGTPLAAVNAWQISPVQAPSYIGDDEAGRSMFSFNVLITTH